MAISNCPDAEMPHPAWKPREKVSLTQPYASGGMGQ